MPRDPSLNMVGQRRGIALFGVVVAIVIIGALVATAMVTGTREFRLGRDAHLELRALEAADHGLVETTRSWPTSRNVTMNVGATIGPDTLLLADSAMAVVRTTRIAPNLFWIISDGSARLGTTIAAERSVNGVYRLASPDVGAAAALTVGDSMSIVGAASISGNDSIPAPWATVTECTGVPGPAIAGVAAADTMSVCDGPCGAAASRITGAPARLADPTAPDTMRYRAFGDESWRTLAHRATIVIPAAASLTLAPRLLGAACDLSAIDNWGDPTRATPCADHYPTIHALGDLTLVGGAGQGVLLVEGDLHLTGAVQFTGLVIVRDDIVTSGAGGSITGAALAADTKRAPGDQTRIDGASRITASRCALSRVVSATALLIPAKRRSWAELF